MFVFILILYWINLKYGSPVSKDANWILGIIVLLQIVVKLMVRSGYIKTAGVILLIIGTAAATAICLKVSGINDEAVFAYVLIILASGYLLGRRIAFAFTVVSIAAIWWIAYLQKNALIIADISDPYQVTRDLTVVLIMVFFIVFFLVKTIDKTLKKFKSELSERIRIESEREKLITQLSEEINERKRAEEGRERLITELKTAFAEVKTLRGIIPICSNCKKIRDDEGYWQQVEEYIQERSEAAFSHGLCHECAEELYPQVETEYD